MKRIFFAVIILLIVSGCANQSSITYYSNPAGATISTDRQVFGVAPQKLLWTLPSGQKNITSENVTATWQSGAKATVTYLLPRGHKGQHTFQRPQGVAGLDVDINWAIHVQQMENQNNNTVNMIYMMRMMQ